MTSPPYLLVSPCRNEAAYARLTLDSVCAQTCLPALWVIVDDGSTDGAAEIRFLHLRPMGSSHKGMWHGRMRHGFGQYFMGSSLLFMVASATYRISKRPYVIGSLAMIFGFLSAMMRRVPRYPDLEFRGFLRRYQRCSLLHGKSRARDLTEESQAVAWHPSPKIEPQKLSVRS